MTLLILGIRLCFILLWLGLIINGKLYRFESIDGMKGENPFKIMTLNSNVLCSTICAQDNLCVSVNYNRQTLSCELNLDNPNDNSTAIVSKNGWTLFYKADEAWTVIFRGSAGNGVNVLSSYLGTNSQNIPSHAPGFNFTQTMCCDTHFRSSLIDMWSELNIQQVKVEMLKNGSTVAYTRFTNIPTDNKMTWFNHDNLLDSSWNDLIHSSANKFTMDDGNGVTSRTFLVNKYYGNCIGGNVDYGWMMVIDVNNKWKPCVYDKHLTYPVFLYVNGSTAAALLPSEYDLADVFMISILR